MPPHPAFFVKRNAYDRFGKFDTNLRISSDYELILRFLYKNGKVILKKVKTGVQDNNYFEIIEGLEEGDEVVTAPYRAISKKLKNNKPVEKVEKENLFNDDE